MSSSSTTTKNTSTSQVVTSLVFNLCVFAAFFASFVLLRLKIKRIYQPKSSFDLISDEKRPEPLPSGIWQWILPLLKKSDNFIIQQAGLDGYFFIRYLFIISAYCGVSMLYMFPVLLTLNAVDGVSHKGFDMFAYSNVNSKGRYYGHVFCGWIFFWGFLFVIYRELTLYNSLRHNILASPRYAKKLSSRTVLFQSVPEQYLSVTEFSKLFEHTKNVWIARGAKELTKLVKERDALAYKLEAAETAYLKKAIKAIKKEKKKNGGATLGHISSDITAYVPDNKRPSHRLKPLVGKKVDTINYVKEKLPELNAKILELQNNHMDEKPLNSVFVEFHTQYDAQKAVQMVAHHSPLSLTPGYVGIAPEDVQWFNLRMFWLERLVRKFGSVSAIVALVILWTFPVAFVGMISNITYLTNELPWLNFIYKMPDVLLGILTSLAPTIALAVLMMLLPIFIRKLAVVGGAPSSQHVEYFTQQAYFAFQVIQVFLITTLASSATSTVTTIIEEPTSAMQLLAENLPKSSNFYMGYIILQGLSISSGALMQIVPLILFYVLGSLLDSTARKKFTRFTSLSSMSWGTVFPVYTNLAVITFSYAIISPLILLFATVGFFLLYVAYLYNLTYVFQESPDSRGIHYPRALFQTMVGLYLGQICLLGLFVVGKGWGPIVLQAICLGVTVFVHLNFNSAFDHLMTVEPVDTMKALDGKSNTPSYTRHSIEPEKEEVQELPAFQVRKYQPRSSAQFDQRTTSILSDNTYEIQTGVFDTDNENNITTIPLLADGDTTPIPAAPFWKRFLQPHIYYSYKAVKNKLPEIYNLPDPREMTDENQIKHAYDFPTVSAKCPYLWIPRDPYGFSTVQIAEFSGIVEFSDEGARFSEDASIIWETAPPSYNDSEMKPVSNPFNEEDEDELDLSN
ncbi:unnamed protein product [Kluyveromyces dobzhanskii CBS 2104]|uniref:WGS project CCBQ000000000 data, contig 00014 n=1 Tax=Kluyveromyces dobzhanskii CBS 2104 TaxID=1427455 RepID=A0A0A8L940_9SACH|nr:unnamed protein product [Kluyveromyces dobzhanskii CBS 2104]